MGKFKDLTGQRFSRLVVLKQTDRNKCSTIRWSCQCDCGNIVKVEGSNLKTEHTQSCGCLNKDKVRKRALKHGHLTNGKMTKTYSAWASMFTRCINENSMDYNDYGGRGITICDRWNDFRNFLEDMGEAPKDLTLDRKNNDGNYEPGNCRWATHQEQGQNNRRTKLTPNIVKIVRHLAKETQFTFVDLAYAFNVSKCCISAVVQRRTWANIN